LQPEVRAATSFENQSVAQSIAASTLAEYDSGYIVTYNSLFNLLGWTTSCSVYLENVNVVYNLLGKPANYTLQIEMNPSLSAVIGVKEYAAQPSQGVVVYDVNWVGPEYYNSSGTWISGADWDVPYVDGPGSGSCNSGCQFAEWVGLSADAGGGSESSPHLAQTGTLSGCDSMCDSSSFYWYNIWYEFLTPTSDSPVPCTSSGGTTAGDPIESDVYTESGYQYYYADSYDETTMQICDGTSPSHMMGESYYAQYMGEWNEAGMPEFSTLTFNDGYYQDTNFDNTYYISNSWTNGYVINLTSSYFDCDGDSVNFNVCPSRVSSGSFSETWDTSQGTYGL
jgi:hypothetical protein